MTWKSYAAMSGAGLLATYLASAPPTITPGRAPAARAVTDAGAARLSDDIEEQAARLESRVPRDVTFRPPARNPFRYGARPSAPGRSAAARPPASEPPAAPPAPEPSLPPPPPPIRLNGIAATTVNGELQRVAVLLTPQGVVEARAGDMAGAYRVVRVDEDAVEIMGPDGINRRLILRP